jgi:thiamine biosynthesis protein ThiI
MDCVVEHDGGHLYVYSSDLAAAADRLTRVFGIVSVSPVARVPVDDLDALVEEAVSYSRHVLEPGQSFAIRARRTGTHPFTSMDLAKAAGAAVMDAFSAKLTVDLGSPDVDLEVEVRGSVAYLYHQRVPAVGGMPPGSQGKVVCPVQTTEDAVAAWLLMRRGCAPVLLVPEGDEEALELTERLRQWDPSAQVRGIAAGEWEWPTFYQHMGWSRSMAVVSGARGPDVPDLPPDRDEPPVVFFPLVGLDEEAYPELETRVMSVRWG